MLRAQYFLRSLQKSWRLQTFRRFASSTPQEVQQTLAGVQPVYEMKPRWYQRGTYFLIFCDVVATMGSVELIWNYWTYWEPAEDAKDGEKAGEWILRPWYHRALGTFMQLSFGGFIAGFLLGTRGRQIRKLWLVPPTVPPPADSPARRLALQTLTTFRATAWEAPMEKCSLSLVEDPTVLAIDVEGVKKRFYIQLDGKSNTVLGKQLPVEPAKGEILRSWYGEAIGRHMLGEGKWKGR